MRLTYIFVVLFAFLAFSSCGNSKKAESDVKSNKLENNTEQNDKAESDVKSNKLENNTEQNDKAEADVQENMQKVADTNVQDVAENSSGNNGEVVKLTTEKFIEQIYDYKANPRKWVYKGDKPAIIDFYADWCGPCKRVAPIMDDLAKEYEGQINIYKIDTDKEKELAGRVFGIRSIPSILFIPAEGQPLMEVGAFPKEAYVNKINKYLIK